MGPQRSQKSGEKMYEADSKGEDSLTRERREYRLRIVRLRRIPKRSHPRT